MRIAELKRTEFLEVVGSIRYRNQDIKEAMEFGCKDIADCYEKMKKEWARYFVAYEGENPVLTVALQRDGHIIFFISDSIQHPIRLTKAMRRFAKKMTKNCGPIITKTASWYEEANRFNKLVGFSLWKVFNRYALWVYPPIDRSLK